MPGVSRVFVTNEALSSNSQSLYDARFGWSVSDIDFTCCIAKYHSDARYHPVARSCPHWF